MIRTIRNQQRSALADLKPLMMLTSITGHLLMRHLGRSLPFAVGSGFFLIVLIPVINADGKVD